MPIKTRIFHLSEPYDSRSTEAVLPVASRERQSRNKTLIMSTTISKAKQKHVFVVRIDPPREQEQNIYL
jgi:hypothetical protein